MAQKGVFIEEFLTERGGRMKVICPALEEGNRLPRKYTCKGEGVSPPLKIEEVPKNAKSLAIVMLDPDAPIKTFIHWLLYDIPPDVEYIEEDERRYKQGRNSLFRIGYFPPCPPYGIHRYIIRIYALDKEMNLKEGATFRKIKKEMKNHVVESAEIVTIFGKKLNKNDRGRGWF